MTEEKKDETIVGMTTETIAGDLMGMLVKQLAIMPDIWAKISEREQKDFIERIRKNVIEGVKQAVKLIAAGKNVTVRADLQKVVFGKDVQAVFAIGFTDPARIDLVQARGKQCLIVITDAQQHMGGTENVKAMSDQPELKGMDVANAVIKQAARRSKDAKPQAQPKDKPKDEPKGDKPTDDL